MSTATFNRARPMSILGQVGPWLTRVLAALDQALASSADGARGF